MKKRSVMKRLAMTMAVLMTAAAASGCGSSSGGGSTTAAPAAPAATEAAGSEAAGGEAKEADTQAAADDWKWERKVTIVCPWGVGGGADGTLRPLQPILEKNLGVPVEIVNVEGAGWFVLRETVRNATISPRNAPITIVKRTASTRLFI